MSTSKPELLGVMESELSPEGCVAVIRGRSGVKRWFTSGQTTQVMRSLTGISIWPAVAREGRFPGTAIAIVEPVHAGTKIWLFARNERTQILGFWILACAGTLSFGSGLYLDRSTTFATLLGIAIAVAAGVLLGTLMWRLIGKSFPIEETPSDVVSRLFRARIAESGRGSANAVPDTVQAKLLLAEAFESRRDKLMLAVLSWWGALLVLVAFFHLIEALIFLVPLAIGLIVAWRRLYHIANEGLDRLARSMD
jgi:hypothetical protein